MGGTKMREDECTIEEDWEQEPFPDDSTNGDNYD